MISGALFGLWRLESWYSHEQAVVILGVWITLRLTWCRLVLGLFALESYSFVTARLI